VPIDPAVAALLQDQSAAQYGKFIRFTRSKFTMRRLEDGGSGMIGLSSRTRREENNLPQNRHLSMHHQDRQRMIFIFDVITECFQAKRLRFLKFFLSVNQDYETFERLAIQPNSWGSEGSLGPVFEKKIEFLKSILPLVSSVKFLKHKLHINNLILEWKERIELENKKQFLGYF
jgi:hypothetical protein